MPTFCIRTLTADDLPQVMALQVQYARRYPGAQVVPGEIYLSPAFEAGQNVFCAVENDGTLLGYAPLYPVFSNQADQPHTLWTEVKTGLDQPDIHTIKDYLYDQVIARAREIIAQRPDALARLALQYTAGEVESIDYARSKGFSLEETVNRMVRDLSVPIAPAPQPPGIEFRPWEMETAAEQAAYVQARNETFPAACITLEEWQHFLTTSAMQNGLTFAAFAGNELTGCATAFWSDEEIALAGVPVGYTEYIFVRPMWRSRGIARRLVTMALEYLRAHDMEQALLEVRARNTGALDLYLDLGYRLVEETLVLTKPL